jgi:hypothetical protein
MEPAGVTPGGFSRCAGPETPVQLFFDRESTPYLMRGRLRLLMSVRTATRNLDLQLAIATLRLSGERESDQSRAKQHDTCNGHCQETIRSELLTHRAPPNRVRPAQSERLACCTVKGIIFRRVTSIEVDVSVQHPNGHASLFPARRHSLRLLRPRYMQISGKI